MDERIFKIKLGKPIPAWDAKHRLPITGFVGPECKDSATIYRVNSTYMDVSEQPHMMRHWLAGGVFTAIVASILFFLFFCDVIYISIKQNRGTAGGFIAFETIAAALGFAYVGFKYARDELFSLIRRPIRFNREKKTIYAIRHRRFFSKEGQGDVTWEIPWDEQTIFCVHRGPENSDQDENYHICCYQLDAAGNVVRAFAIGREWTDLTGMNDLLCQWNYWCWYMNNGPSELPPPLLFLGERETIFESFLYCMYEAGFGLSSSLRIFFLPFFAWMTIQRVLALWTCRPHVWPASVNDICVVDKDDPYNQPSGLTPIGWAKTSQAHMDDSYPEDPRMRIPNWAGEKDGLRNAELWRENIAPRNS